MKINKNILLSLLITIFFSNLDAKIIETEQLFNKKITKVIEEDISISKSFYGKTVLDESQIVDIVTRFDGYLTKLNANNTYMNIKKGDALFSIYSDDIMSIQNEIKIAKSFNNNLYNSALVKLQTLNISANEVDRIKKGKITSSGITISSPVNGILLKKNVNNFSAVKKGNLLLQVASLEKLWFIASIYQNDLPFVKKDMKAQLYVDGITNPIETKVDYIYPTFDDKTKTVDVRFVLDNKDLKLYPSMFAKVEIKNTAKTMLTLPKSAVLLKGNKFYVFKTISDKEIEPVKIEARRISSDKYEILDGLDAGVEVIDNALFLLDSDAITNALYNSDKEEW